MQFVLRFTNRAEEALQELEDGGQSTAAKLKKVRKTLGYLQVNPRHPGLHSHQYENFPGHTDDKVWDSYVENATPGAWRVFWMYGPNEKDDDGNEVPVITILVISAHP